MLEGETLIYEGTAENGNQMYFSNVKDRLGVLVAPFSEDSKSVSFTYSGMTLVVTTPGGTETGILDGKVLESEGNRVVPGFSACPECGSNPGVINQVSYFAATKRERDKIAQDKEDAAYKLRMASEKKERERFVAGTGGGWSSSVSTQGDTTKNEAEFDGKGNVKMKSVTGR